jgi:2-dehydro-3-deoxyphosphogluconate aldolase/(4S)-4-hydroxy-2-oxoglutarate aldolase
MMDTLLKDHPFIPIATVDSVDDACWLANVLLKNDINIVEITLRTPVALEAVTVLRQEFKELSVGVGTVTTVDELTDSLKAGANFAVSPGFMPFMVTQAEMYSLPFLPGIATVSEAMQAKSLGLKAVKVYPIESLGGVIYLKALHAVLPTLSFCPTGGIHESNCQDYAALPFVRSLGMSQLASKAFIANQDERAMSQLIKQCRENIQEV